MRGHSPAQRDAREPRVRLFMIAKMEPTQLAVPHNRSPQRVTGNWRRRKYEHLVEAAGEDVSSADRLADN